MYETLLIEAEDEEIEVIEVQFKSKRIKGLYCDGVIATNKNMCSKNKACVLAEELGHHYKTYGNILDQSIIANVKEERKARVWAYNRLVSLTKLTEAFDAGIKNRYELSEYLGVTEKFIDDALNYYHQKYGIYQRIGVYVIYFNPLRISKDLF